MGKTRFIHTADWHFRDYQYGRRFRGEDFRVAARDVLRLAEKHGVGFIINGGDTLNTAHPSGSMQDALWETDEKLLRLGIPMFTVTGNHDSAEPSFLTFPGRGHTDREGGVVCIDGQTIETAEGVTIAGYRAIPSDEFLEKLDKADPVDIVVWHGAVREFCGFPSPDALSLGDLPIGKCKAFLLGDLHVSERARLSDGTLVAYPGPIEMCEKGEAAEKFVDYYELTGDWRSKPFPDPVQLKVKSRPVVFLQVMDDAEADEALETLRRRMEEDERQPMVFMRYHRDMVGIKERIMSMLDMSKTVFRASAFRDVKSATVSEGRRDSLPELAAMVDEVIPPGTDMHKLCVSLCDPEANHNSLVSDWIEDRQEEIEKGIK